MKHALIITTISGFVPQFEMNDVKILKEYGYQVHYASDFKNPVYSIDKEKLEAEGMVLHHIDIKKSPFRIKHQIKAYRQLKRIIREENIQLVHCHNPMGGEVGRLAAKASKKNPYVIYTAHGFHFYKGAPKKNWMLFYTAERFLARYTDRLITINHEDYDRACRFHLKKGGKVERIPGVGVDMKKFCRQDALRGKKRAELGIPENAFHIVSVGELVENKNHEIMIRAIGDLPMKDVYYSICGYGGNLEHLKKLINASGLEERVQLLGYRTDIPEVLQSADCFAFPSKREGLGIASIEAMACAVPMIAADNRGTREYMHDKENGIVCDPYKIEEFKNAIIELYQSEELREYMAINCRTTAEQFGIEATDKIMRRIYGEIDISHHGSLQSVE